MKYGLVVYEGQQSHSQKKRINVGNYIQWIAIRNLYRYMKIDEDNIVELSVEELSKYDNIDVPIILPINYLFVDSVECPYMCEGKINFGMGIHPVFLSFAFRNGFWDWTEEKIQYFKKHEPIGCRDYLTYKTLKRLNIQCYLAGCLTLTLPRRDMKSVNERNTYFVEVPEFVKDDIPIETYNQGIYKFHDVKLTDDQWADRYFGINYTENLLKEYREKAKLVIASRLHAIAPCIAMGIPVIGVKEYFGPPFDLLKKFIPFYTSENHKDIDWNPQQLDIEEYKIIALECAKARLLGEPAQNEIDRLHQEYANLYSLENYTEERMSMQIFKEEVENRYKPDDKIAYAIWGLGDYGEWIYQYMTENFPNAKLVHAIDTYKEIEFHGLKSELPNILLSHNSFITLVSTLNCSSVALQLFNSLNKDKQEYVCITSGVLGKEY